MSDVEVTQPYSWELRHDHGDDSPHYMIDFTDPETDEYEVIGEAADAEKAHFLVTAANDYRARLTQRPADGEGRRKVAQCIEIVRETRDGFLCENYATNQPMGSFAERFACDQVAAAIEQHFGMGTVEQCRLLGKPTPVEEYRAALATKIEEKVDVVTDDDRAAYAWIVEGATIGRTITHYQVKV